MNSLNFQLKPSFSVLLLFLGIIYLSVLLYNCEQREFVNPYGGDISQEEWSPDSFNISQGKVNEAILKWSAVNKNIEGFKIIRNYKDNGNMGDTIIAVLNKNAITYTDTHLIPDTSLTYIYTLYAFAGENESVVKMDSIKPRFPAPTNFRYAVFDRSLASLIMSWNDNSDGEEGYIIKRKLGENEWKELAKTNENINEFVDQIPTNVFVQYQIIAYKGGRFSFPLIGYLAMNEKNSLVFGGSKNDILNSICQASDYSYVAVGSTESPEFNIFNNDTAYINSKNALLVEFDHRLNVSNIVSFGGTGDDLFKKVIAVNDGLIILGETNSTDHILNNRPGLENNWILKLDFDFNIVWSTFFENELSDIKVLNNGNMALCGKNNENGWIVFLDNNGHKLTDKTFGGDGNDWFNNMDVIENDTILVAGAKTAEDNNSDIWLTKLNSSGDEVFSKNYRILDFFEKPQREEGLKGEVVKINVAFDQFDNEKQVPLIVLHGKSFEFDYSDPEKRTNILRILKLNGDELGQGDYFGIIKISFLGVPYEYMNYIANSMLSFEDNLISAGKLNYLGDGTRGTSLYIMRVNLNYWEPEVMLWESYDKDLSLNFEYSEIKDNILSLNGNCLAVGSVGKSGLGEDCLIMEVDINTGQIAQLN